MKLIAILFALILGHLVKPVARLRYTGWLVPYVSVCRRMFGKLPGFEGWVGVVIMISIPTAIVVAAMYSIHGAWHGLADFLFALLVLVYCWGPRDLDLDVNAYVSAMLEADRDKRKLAAADLFSGEIPDEPREQASSVASYVFLGALERWFGVMLWFLLLGPAGAIAYRVTQELAHTRRRPVSISTQQAECLRLLRRCFDWPVAVLITVSLALVSHFDAVFHAWKGYYQREGRSFFDFDLNFMYVSARHALNFITQVEADGKPPGNDVDRVLQAMSLVWRVLLFVWLPVIAVCYLGMWFS